jgi:NAD(P)-dependent dehydrogenase (short-subunit alcohol dehydrogenase family)
MMAKRRIPCHGNPLLGKENRKSLATNCDVSQLNQVATCIERIDREFGALTGLLNNAGITSEVGSAPIVEATEDLWLSTINVNLNGVSCTSRAAARVILAQGRQSIIVNISSLAGRFEFTNYGIIERANLG